MDGLSYIFTKVPLLEILEETVLNLKDILSKHQNHLLSIFHVKHLVLLDFFIPRYPTSFYSHDLAQSLDFGVDANLLTHALENSFLDQSQPLDFAIEWCIEYSEKVVVNHDSVYTHS